MGRTTVGPEEVTTKIKIPTKRSANLIYVDFKKNILSSRITYKKKSNWFKNIISNIDIGAPWLIRLILLVSILIISMLLI